MCYSLPSARVVLEDLELGAEIHHVRLHRCADQVCAAEPLFALFQALLVLMG